MIALTILFLVFLLVGIVLSIRLEMDFNFVEELGGVLFIGFIVSLVFSFVLIDSHSSDLAIVRTAEETIRIHQEAIEEVDRQMKDLSVPNTSLMNADSPYHSLIKLRGERIESLAKAKVNILDSKKNILSRKLGIWSRDIVWLLGDK